MPNNTDDWVENLLNPELVKEWKTTTLNTPSPRWYSGSGSGVDKQRSNTPAKKTQKPDIAALQVQKAWEIALQPAKSIPMNFFMSYMSGTSLQIIPIMTALMLLSGPIKSVFTIRQAFKPVLGNPESQSQVYGIMCLYILFQAILVFIGLQKLNAMGLIPNKTSDWMAWENVVNYNKGLKAFAF
ncbi:ER membrane protein complex subunit 4 [Nakaseomyces bracarensis]|uniref:ER membrane protein complex subunit 4 n=1 Tax=Nakaseomyces bracarensis TaxID=273131 RepID=A0ABR4NUI5_9SACH